MNFTSNKYSRLIHSDLRQAEAVALTMSGIVKHLQDRLANIEAYIENHRDLFEDTVLEEEDSKEYAFYQLGSKLVIEDVLELLKELIENKKG